MTDLDSSQSANIPPDVYCPGCGYLLFGSAGERCSECGYALAGMREAESGIPWVHRRTRGRIVSFFKTVWLVTFRNRRFCEEFARDVSYRDARRFQWVVILHVLFPVLLAVAALYWMVPPDLSVESFMNAMMWGRMPIEPTTLEYAYAEFWPVALLLVGFLMWLIAIAGVASYFFHPKEISVRRQNSGVAMSCYACAPLAVLPMFLVVAAILVENFANYGDLDPLFYLAYGAIVLGILLVWYWWMLVGTIRRTMPQLRVRAMVLAVGLPMIWLALAVLILAGIPVLTLWILIVIDSLAV